MREMKECELLFVEDIPCDWKIIPNRFLFYSNGQKVGNLFGEYQLLSLTTAGIKKRDINSTGGKMPTSYEGYQTVEKGQMVFCLFDLDCSAVFSGISEYNGMITSAYNVYSDTKFINNQYADYWFKYVFSNRYYMMYSKNIRYSVTNDAFKALLTPVPPLDEQKRIATFLDTKCSQIDTLIANQEKQIEKLKSYKQSLITEVVTKGLNPDAPMKDSGVEWIGEIPADWEVCRIKNLFALRNERNYEELSKVNLISLYTDLGVIQHSDVTETTGNKAVTADGYKIVHKGDIVVNIILCWMGAVGKSKYDGVTSPAYDVYKPKNEVSSDYYHYLFRTKAFNGECFRYGRGIMLMRWRTYSSEFKAICVPFPNITEQQQIVDYLDKKCADIDELLKIKQSKIEKLTEYKKSLIYEYVTGKKEVQ